MSKPVYHEFINKQELENDSITINYRAAKQRVDVPIKRIEKNLKQVSACFDDKPGESEQSENEALYKMKQIHKNEKVLKNQLNKLVHGEFATFHKKLQKFDTYLNNHFDNEKGVGGRINHIQSGAEQMDRTIRILETTRKIIEDNKI